jgi:hypothetical protein
MSNSNLEAFQSTRKRAQPSSRGGALVAAHGNTHSPTATNPHGYGAFTPSFARDIFRMTQCGIIGNTYYSKAEDQAREMFRKFEEAAQIDPLMLLKALVLSRRSNIKMAPKLGIVALSRNAEFCAQYEDVIVELLCTYHPKQLREYVEMQKTYAAKGFGYRQQRWVTKVMKSWSLDKLEGYTIKYKEHMNVLLRLTHPDWNEPRLDYVFKAKEGTLKGQPYGEKQKAFDQVIELTRRPGFDVDRVGRIILENELPFESLKAIPCQDPRWWFALMMGCGVQGLLLNTRSFIDKGVFQYPAALEKYREMLSPEAIRRSRMNPLDIVKSYVHIEDPAIKAVLSDALAYSFDVEIPGIGEDVLEISVDSSGSMRGGLGNADQHAYLLANILAYTFYGKAHSVRYSWFYKDNLVFEGHQHRARETYHAKSGRFPAWTGNRSEDMKMILDYPYEAGYTNPSLIVERAIKDRKYVDKFIIVTDEAQNQGRPLHEAFLSYQSKIHADAKLIVINSGNQPWSAVPNCPDQIVYNTMTPAIFTAISGIGQDVASVLNSVEL